MAACFSAAAYWAAAAAAAFFDIFLLPLRDLVVYVVDVICYDGVSSSWFIDAEFYRAAVFAAKALLARLARFVGDTDDSVLPCALPLP